MRTAEWLGGSFMARRTSAAVASPALQQMVKTFFDGSAASAATALLGLSRKLKPEEIDALQKAIDAAKERKQ